MKSISFYDYGLEDIFCRRKVSTLRFGENGFSKGEIVRLMRQDQSFCGYLLLTSVDNINYGNLTETDALIENWSSLFDLKKRLLTSYPFLNEDSTLTRISFSYIDDLTDVKRKIEKEHTRPRDIKIITTSESKFNRFEAIFKNYYNISSEWMKPIEEENPLEFSCEKRALAKLIKTSKYSQFSTDDMITINADNRIYHIQNIKQLSYFLSFIKQDEFEIIIRTALALKTSTTQISHPVFRTFLAKKNKHPRDEKLNDIIYLKDTGEKVSEIDKNDIRLIKPFVDVLTILLNGGLQ